MKQHGPVKVVNPKHRSLLDILVLNAVLECILDKTKKQVEVFWLSGEAVESTPSLSPAATMWFSPLFHYTGFVFKYALQNL